MTEGRVKMAKGLMTTDEFRDELIRRGRRLTMDSSRVRVGAKRGVWIRKADATRLSVSERRILRTEAEHVLVGIGVVMSQRKFFTEHDVEIVLVAKESRGMPPRKESPPCPKCGAWNTLTRITCRKCGVQLRERKRAPKTHRKGKEVITGGSSGTGE